MPGYCVCSVLASARGQIVSLYFDEITALAALAAGVSGQVGGIDGLEIAIALPMEPAPGPFVTPRPRTFGLLDAGDCHGPGQAVIVQGR